MQYDDIRIELYEVLSLPENHGKYKTCTEICEALETLVWQGICDAYSSACYGNCCGYSYYTL